MVTLDQLHQLVDVLPEAERETAARVLAALAQRSAVSGPAFFDAVAGQAVVRPEAPPISDIDALRGGFWPEDEGPDDFVNTVRAWRREGSDG